VVKTLMDFGFEGEVFWKEVPQKYQQHRRVSTRSEATTAFEIHDAIEKANTPGKKYIILGRKPYNCHDQHIADERACHREETKQMKTAKARAEVYAKKESDCKALIQSCSGDLAELRVTEMKKMYEW